MPETVLRLIHLSDIHFNRDSNADPTQDQDAELRLALVRDAKTEIEKLGQCDGILVVGDIAYSGGTDEYAFALEWLKSLCDSVNCPQSEVWCVPGNHDVTRSRGGAVRASIIHELRELGPKDVAKKLLSLLSDADAKVLFTTLHEYNVEFARKFDCDISESRPFWEDGDSLKLNDGRRIVLRGVTSVFASDKNDSIDNAKLVLGETQLHHKREPDCVHLVLCHHPPDWLRDQDLVEQALTAYADVQLFGHKHTQAIRVIDGKVRIYSGALHPKRSETDWNPRYNVIELKVVDPLTKPRLQVRVNSRLWDQNGRRFKVDSADEGGSSWTVREVDLPVWHGLSSQANNAPSSEAPLLLATNPEVQPIRRGNPNKILANRFYGLPYTVRVQVASELGLVDNSDEGVVEPARSRRYFERARAKMILERLWETVRVRTNAPDMDGPNPFKGR